MICKRALFLHEIPLSPPVFVLSLTISGRWKSPPRARLPHCRKAFALSLPPSPREVSAKQTNGVILIPGSFLRELSSAAGLILNFTSSAGCS